MERACPAKDLVVADRQQPFALAPALALLISLAPLACSATDALPISATSDPTTDAAASSASTPDASRDAAHDAASDAGASASDSSSPAPPAAPSAFVTTDDLAQRLAPVNVTRGDAAPADVTVTVDPSTTYQSVLGFGASITDSSSYVMVHDLSQAARKDLLTALFDPAHGIGLSFLRQPMGASDFSSAGNFSYDDGAADPSLARFSIAQDLKATIPVLKEVLATSADVFIMATPWSPPAWMKNNASMDGSGGAAGSSGLSGNAYGPFADYFVKFAQAYAQQGIAVRAVTPENEPQNGSASYPAMDLNAPSELALIAQHMGPAFKSAGLTTQIWAFDHNWDNESYPAQIMADATAASFTEGAAFHCYGGDVSAMTTFHQAYPQKSIYMTECSGGDWQSDPFADTIDLLIGSMNNWARAVSLWNMALDENKGPQNAGCSTCRGVVTVNSQSGKVDYNADYYALGHFAKLVRPGAVRVASASSRDALREVAFKGADGGLVLVAHNTSASVLSVRVGVGAPAMTVRVPAGAAVTLRWSEGG